MIGFNYLKNIVVNAATLIFEKISYVYNEIFLPPMDFLIRMVFLPFTYLNRGIEYLLISLIQSERFNILGIKPKHVPWIMLAILVVEGIVGLLLIFLPLNFLSPFMLGQTFTIKLVAVILEINAMAAPVTRWVMDEIYRIELKIRSYIESEQESKKRAQEDASVNIVEEALSDILTNCLNNALENNDITDAINVLPSYFRLLDVYGPSPYLRLPLMQKFYDDINNNKIGPWKGVSKDILSHIEKEYEYKDIYCHITRCLKTIPVVVIVPGYEYIYKCDLLPLLNRLHDVNPRIRECFGEELIKLSHIKQDTETYNLILRTAAKAKDMQDNKFYSDFNGITQQAVATNNFAEVLLKLQVNEQKYDADLRSVPWNEHLQLAYDNFIENSKTVDEHSQKYRCGITFKAMQNPVYIEDRKGVKHYFELFALLHWIKENDNLSMIQNDEEVQDSPNACNAYLLSQIVYDADMKATLDGNNSTLVAKPPLQFSTSRTVSANNDSYFSRAFSNVSRVTYNFRETCGF